MGDFKSVKNTTRGVANDSKTFKGVLESTGPEGWPTGLQIKDLKLLADADWSGADFDSEGNLWVVNNGTATLAKLTYSGNGSYTVSQTWTMQYPNGSGTPDAEGVTIGPDGAIYVATERDNGDKKTSRPSVLRYVPTSRGGNLPATNEWNFKSIANVSDHNGGLEAISYIPDFGANQFAVGVEETGEVLFVELDPKSNSTRLLQRLKTPFSGVMALDYRQEEKQLRALCDDACNGQSILLEFDPGAQKWAQASEVESRPANLGNTANEGYASYTLSGKCVSGKSTVTTRFAWVDDGESDGVSIRTAEHSTEVECKPEPTTPPAIPTTTKQVTATVTASTVTTTPTEVASTVTTTPTVTTTAKTVTVVPTTTADAVTVVPTTTADAVTVVPTTTADPVTVVPTTTADAVTVVPTTTADPVTVVPTTTVDAVTTTPTEIASTVTTTPTVTTTAKTVTVVPTTTADAVTVVPTTTADAVTTTPTEIASTVTTTPTEVASTVTTTPTEVASTVTTTPTEVASTVTTTPTEVASTVTTTPTTTADAVTTTPTEIASTVTTTPTVTTTAKTVTVVPTTTADAVTVVPTTTADAVTVVPTTTADAVTVVPTTTADAVTVVPTTTADAVTTTPTEIASTVTTTPTEVASTVTTTPMVTTTAKTVTETPRTTAATVTETPTETVTEKPVLTTVAAPVVTKTAEAVTLTEKPSAVTTTADAETITETPAPSTTKVKAQTVTETPGEVTITAATPTVTDVPAAVTTTRGDGESVEDSLLLIDDFFVATVGRDVEEQLEINGIDIEELPEDVVSVEGLPAGLRYDAAARRIIGIPEVTGTATATVQLADGDVSRTGEIRIAVIAPATVTETAEAEASSAPESALEVLVPRTATGTVGLPLEIPVRVVGEGEVTVDGLPEGLTFDNEKSRIHGAPTAAGESTAVISINDGEQTASAELQISVEDLPTVTVTPEAPSEDGEGKFPISSVSGTKNEPLKVQLELEGVENVEVTGLPRGLRYDAQLGAITGRPEESGTFEVVVVTQRGDQKLETALNLEVAEGRKSSETETVTVTPTQTPVPGAENTGSAEGSSISDRCVAALAGWGVPLIALVPLAAISQMGLPVAAELQASIDSAMRSLNEQFGGSSNSIATQYAIDPAVRKQLEQVGGVMAGIAIAALVVGTIVNACAEGEGSSR
ncbi:esterase-like activity of phytase family protein [Corynebacterium afermentans]|uniref:esterase-like activity of phytase family protein n=1 Tax=Corynebacterium afermentans TaxID=38286 RepID=UPI003B967B3A